MQTACYRELKVNQVGNIVQCQVYAQTACMQSHITLIVYILLLVDSPSFLLRGLLQLVIK